MTPEASRTIGTEESRGADHQGDSYYVNDNEPSALQAILMQYDESSQRVLTLSNSSDAEDYVPSSVHSPS
jgi:hypothetical protein